MNAALNSVMNNRIIFSVLLMLSSVCFAQSDFDRAEHLRMKKDYEEAIKHYYIAFESGSPEAAHWLGAFYYDGVGVPKNAAVAGAYFYAAANAGVVGSMVYLANMHISGNGVSKNCKKAEEWIRKFSNGSMPLAWVEQIADCKEKI